MAPKTNSGRKRIKDNKIRQGRNILKLEDYGLFVEVKGMYDAPAGEDFTLLLKTPFLTRASKYLEDILLKYPELHYVCVDVYMHGQTMCILNADKKSLWSLSVIATNMSDKSYRCKSNTDLKNKINEIIFQIVKMNGLEE